MKNKKEKKIEKIDKRNDLDLDSFEEGRITHCPLCNIELISKKSCIYITCPCAPRITV